MKKITGRGGPGRGQGLPRGKGYKNAKKPPEDVKSVPFAGQRWTEAKAQPWFDFMKAFGMSKKEFQERAFDHYVQAGCYYQLYTPGTASGDVEG